MSYPQFDSPAYVPPGAVPDQPPVADAEPLNEQLGGGVAEEEGVAFVYVPTRPYEPVESGAQEVEFELRRLSDGSAGMALFTEEESLVAELGEHQPFIKISVLDLLVQLAPEKVPVVVNPTLRAGVQRWTPTDSEKWKSGAE